MPLHRLTHIVIGVPNVQDTADYYRDFGLSQTSATTFATRDGGEQLQIKGTRRRRLIEIGVGADDRDDLDRTAHNLSALGIAYQRDHIFVQATDAGTGVAVTVTIAERLTQRPAPMTSTNGPGRIDRPNNRADAIQREGTVRPRKLGHVVVGSTDQQASQRFFVDGLGFKVSDTVPGLAAFLRCSTDHHNLLVQNAPVQFLHHTSWQVDDVDEVGRGATAMLADHPERHVWGLGRHHIGSNFFWYLKDPAGNFSEYYSDLDSILDDQLWTPGVWEGARALYKWGPPPPPSFLEPEDLAALMTGAHDGRV